MSNKCEVCGGSCMTSPCRGCKMSGKTAPRVEAIKQEMNNKPGRKELADMSDSEILDECSEWMAKKNGGTAEQTKATLSNLPASHVKTMLESLRAGK